MKKSNKQRKRGNLLEFYDPTVAELLERPKTANNTVNKPFSESKPKLTASLSYGHLQLNEKLLRDEVEADFQDRWFMRTNDRVYGSSLSMLVWLWHYLRKHNQIYVYYLSSRSTWFDSPPILRPTTALIREYRSAFSDNDTNNNSHSTPQSNTLEGSINSNQSKKEKQENKQNPDTSDSAGKTSRSRTLFMHSINSQSKALSPQQRVFQRQVQAIGSVLSSRKTMTKLNKEVPKSISADYVLFMQCMRKNVLPFGAGHFNNQDSIYSGDEDDVERKGIVTIKELEELADDISEDSGSTISFHNEVIAIERSTVIELNLAHRGLGAERGVCLAEALAFCPSLSKVKLNNNRLNDLSLTQIISALFTHCCCTELDLSENEFGSSSVNCLADEIKVTTICLLFS
jgi:hypothetical protein